MKKRSLNGIIIVLVILFAVGIIFSIWSRLSERERDIVEGDPDRLGSHSYVNQEIKKPASWIRIVKDSPFQLGDIFEKDGQNFREYGTYPKIDGSTVTLAMAYEFAWQHLGWDDYALRYFVGMSTTHYAYLSLIEKDSGYPTEYQEVIMDADKKVDLILATYPSEEELAAAEKAGVELLIKPICYDAFVFITHADNPVDSLTIEQVQKIYTGEITNWNEVGGNDERIIAYQREANSGSQTGMETMVMQGLEMADPRMVEVVYGMGALVEAVAEYENETQSIGYTYRYYIDNLYKNPDIKILKIEGIEPNAENMQNESYPFTTNYYGVIRAEDQNQIGGQFLDWILSDEGQQCIEQAGYVPLQ